MRHYPAVRLLRRLLLVALSMGLMLVTAEAILRFFPRFKPKPHFVTQGATNDGRMFVADPQIGWRLAPNYRSPDGTVTSNAQGFRSPYDFDHLERPIVVVGDSFSFGSGVTDAQTYAAQLDSTDAPVANLAIPGFGVDQIWLTVAHRALALKPRLLVVGVVELDFERSQRAYDPGKGFTRPWFRLAGGSLVEGTPADVPGGLFGWLDAHGRLWRAGQLAMQTVGRYRPMGDWWTLNAAFLTAIAHDAQAQHVPVLFVRLPTIEWLPFPLLRTHVASLGAGYLDLRDELQTPPAGMFFPLPDGHPTATGHRLITDTIRHWLAVHP